MTLPPQKIFPVTPLGDCNNKHNQFKTRSQIPVLGLTGPAHGGRAARRCRDLGRTTPNKRPIETCTKNVVLKA